MDQADYQFEDNYLEYGDDVLQSSEEESDDSFDFQNDIQEPIIIDDKDRKYFENQFRPFFQANIKNQLELPEQEIVPRPYQIELFEKSIEKNSIIYLDTGRGKTLVATMHVYYHMKKYGLNKKIIFLGTTIQLVEQQCSQIKKYLYSVAHFMEEKLQHLLPVNLEFDINQLKDQAFLETQIIAIHSDKQFQSKEKVSDLRWTSERWEVLLEESTVYIMIGQILLNALRRAYLRLSDIGVIIFDECHHATKQHPYHLIVKEFYDNEKARNLIEHSDKVLFLGLTASPVTQINIRSTIQQGRLPGKVLTKDLLSLCMNLHSNYVCPVDSVAQETKKKVLNYNVGESSHIGLLEVQFRDIHQMYKELDFHMNMNLNQLSFATQILIQQVSHYLTESAITLLYDIGRYAFFKYLTTFSASFRGLLTAKKCASSHLDETTLEKIGEIMERYLKQFQGFSVPSDSNNFQDKFSLLVDTLLKEMEANNDEELAEYEMLMGSDANIQSMPMILIFVKHQITAQYLCEAINDLIEQHIDEYIWRKLKCDFVIGASGKDNYSLENRILNQRNVHVAGNLGNVKQLFQMADQLYEKFRIDDPENIFEENKQEDEEQLEQQEEKKDEDQNQVIQNLKEMHEGQKRFGAGKELQSIIYELKRQIKVIGEFRQKLFNVLISTSVTEEGFDIPDCNMVIVYGKVYSLQQYIQQKGRARRADSKFVVITNEQVGMAEQKMHYLDHALNYIQNEARIVMNYSQQEIALKLQEVRSDIMLLNQIGQAAITEKLFKNCFIKNNFAQINTNWAVEILTNYAHYVQGERSGVKNEYYIKGPFYYYAELPGRGYICYIILPKYASKRYFVGDVQSTKDEAKRIAAHLAVIELYKNNDILDDLRPKKSIAIRQNNMFKEDLKDSEYANIIQEKVIIKEEINDDVVNRMRFFPSYINEALQFKEIKTFQLFKFKFLKQSDYLQNLKPCNYPEQVDIGFLHCIPHQIDPAVFRLSDYKNKVEFLQIKTLQLTTEQYKYLRKVHYFLQATTKNWDIQLYSSLFQQPIKKGSYLDKGQNNPPFDSIDYELNHAILVCLKNDDFDMELANNIIEYIKHMESVYKHINDIKDIRLQNRLKKEEYEKLKLQGQSEAQQYKQKYKRVDVDNEHIKLLETDYDSLKDNYVMQNVSENFFIGKMVFRGAKQGCNLSQIESQAGKTMQERALTIRNQIKYEFSTDWICSAQILGKHLRSHLNGFMGIPHKQGGTAELKYKFFRGEFWKFPLNLGTIFQIKIILEYLMQQIRDYLLACQLKFNQLQFQTKGSQTVQIKILDNIIASQSFRLMEFLNNHRNGRLILNRLESNNYRPFKGEETKIISKNPLPLILSDKVDSNLIFRCLQSKTYNMRNESNYEVYEFLGDAILKLLSTLQVFADYPLSMEGDLHVARARIVSNENLRKYSVKNGFYYYIMSFRFDYEPEEFKQLNKIQDPNLLEGQDIKKQNQKYRFKDKELYTYPANYKPIPEKVHADVIEALNGAYMETYQDIEACQIFLNSIGVLKYPRLSFDVVKSEQNFDITPLLMRNLETVQSILNYKFESPSILIQALTHSSFLDLLDEYKYNEIRQNQIAEYTDKLNVDFKKISNLSIIEQQKIVNMMNEQTVRPEMSYERLEFLGDAVLDAVTVEWLVKRYPNDTPGDLSLKKQCIVCNKALSLVTLHYEFDKFILHSSLDQPSYKDVINKIRNRQRQYKENINEMYSQEPMVKILGDIFESLVGAVFLDSQCNYEVSKSVILRLLEKEFMIYFTSPNQLLKNPQDAIMKYFKYKNLGDVQLVLSDEEPLNGEYLYSLTDMESNKVINQVRSVGEKEAYEKIAEIVAKKL